MDEKTNIAVNQHKLFYQQMRSTTPLQGIMASVWFGILNYHDDSVYPILWLLVFLAFLTFRFTVYSKIKRWDDFMIASRLSIVNKNGLISAAINGLLWSTYFIYAYYHFPESWMTLFSAFVIILMASGFITLSSHRHTFYAFNACFVVPIIGFTFMFVDRDSTLFYMGFLYIAFSVNIFDLHKNINRTIIESLTNAIENKRLAKSLQQLSNTDSLTKLSNRRHFEELSKLILQEAIDLKQHIAIIMIDIDFFKSFNDNYGHLRGDNVLEQVAKAAKGAMIKPNDIIARFGGEEFIVILPNTSEDGATKLAKRLVKVIESLEIENAHSKASRFITISAGLAVVQPTENFELKDLINTADKALYQAKKNGRNQVSIIKQAAV